MKELFLTIIIILPFVSPLFSGDFPAFVYDMNSAGQLCNENGLDYLSSMAECGIDYVIWTETADMEATRNTYGLKIIGQDSLMTIDNKSLPDYVAYSHKLVAEVELNQAINGYQFLLNAPSGTPS